MSQPELGRFGLGPIEQVAFVVESLERSLSTYEAIYGSFQVGEASLEDCVTPDGPQSCTLKIAVNDAGPVEIELIEVMAGSPPHSEHLEKHGEGLHHVRFRVDSVDEKLATLEAEGFRSLLYKRFGPTLAFAYVETPPAIGGSIIELFEFPEFPEGP